jgi:hypothetical protein
VDDPGSPLDKLGGPLEADGFRAKFRLESDEDLDIRFFGEWLLSDAGEKFS